MKMIVLSLLLTIWSSAALAGLTEQQVKSVSLSPPERARRPHSMIDR